MKITMLGTTGSGKTVYMSAMAELFFHGNMDGYSIGNRNTGYESDAFVYRGFDEGNTLYQSGRFPSGTSSSLVMPLELRFRGTRILDIDWIDYRGGAIKELALGVDDPENAEIFAALIASDVVLVFVDAAVLKVCENKFAARAMVGANEISQLLSMVSRKKRIDVLFLLSKADSSIINIAKDLPMFQERIDMLYGKFFSDTNTSITQYNIIPVAACGYGNVQTTYKWESDGKGGQQLIFDNKVTNFAGVNPVNVASSFAMALLKCLDRELKRLHTDAASLARELEALEKNFGPVKNLIDMLFYKSKKREHIHDLKSIILESRGDIRALSPHRPWLDRIISGNR